MRKAIDDRTQAQGLALDDNDDDERRVETARARAEAAGKAALEDLARLRGVDVAAVAVAGADVCAGGAAVGGVCVCVWPLRVRANAAVSAPQWCCWCG